MPNEAYVNMQEIMNKQIESLQLINSNLIKERDLFEKKMIHYRVKYSRNEHLIESILELITESRIEDDPI